MATAAQASSTDREAHVSTPDLPTRVAAVRKVAAKYEGKPFAYGTADCIRLARSTLVALGAKGLPRTPRYTSEKTALRRLAEAGHESLESLIAAHATPIPASRALPGDLGILPGAGALRACVVYAGNGLWLGWHAAYPGGLRAVRVGVEQVFRV